MTAPLRKLCQTPGTPFVPWGRVASRRAAVFHRPVGRVGDGQAVTLREVLPSDLPTFFRNQQDPLGNELAAFPARSWEDFLLHRKQLLLGNSTTIESTVLTPDGAVAGHVLSWQQDGKRFLGYWLGRQYWGKGIATAALRAFLRLDVHRPLFAHVALHNPASRRVLEKCGLHRVGGPARAPDGVEEYLYRLDAAREPLEPDPSV